MCESNAIHLLCLSSGYQGKGAESFTVRGEVCRAAGSPLHVHLLPWHPQLSFPACWRWAQTGSYNWRLIWTLKGQLTWHNKCWCECWKKFGFLHNSGAQSPIKVFFATKGEMWISTYSTLICFPIQVKQQVTSFKTTQFCPTLWPVWSLVSWSLFWSRAHPHPPP